MPHLTVEQYATLSVELSQCGRTPPAAHGATAAPTETLHQCLARYQLSEQRWEQESEYWEEQLSRALEGSDGPSPLLTEYSNAVQLAQQRLRQPGLGLEEVAEILSALRRGVALDHILRERRVSLEQFLAAQATWMKVAQRDADVRHRLETAVR